jgi:hypothetical protein
MSASASTTSEGGEDPALVVAEVGSTGSTQDQHEAADQHQEHEVDHDPGDAEQAATPVDWHPRPRRAPDAQRRVRGRDEQERRCDQHAQLDQPAAEARAHLEGCDPDGAGDEGRGGQQDVVLLERCRGGLGDAARRQAAEAGWQGVVGRGCPAGR